MNYNNLPRTNVKVSEICLGTMTWGSQNTQAEAHQQIDYALDHGVNFIDTAEMYPTTPVSPKTQGQTEEFIGTWLEKSPSRRNDFVLATKITGSGLKHIRDGERISPQAITNALEGSLKRLHTDHVDLYQLHWPNRGSYHFRQIWNYDPTKQDRAKTIDDINDTLNTLNDLIKQGKIRHIGLSNESVWGTMQYIALAEEKKLPRVITIQNEYNIMHRLFDQDFAELSHNEDVGLLAYSPLAAGLISGKYNAGAKPKGSRRDVSNETLHSRYSKHSQSVADKYVALAHKNDLDVNQMALAFCLTRPFMTSVIIGATTMDQLKTNIAATETTLSKNVLDAIQAIHKEHPLPF